MTSFGKTIAWTLGACAATHVTAQAVLRRMRWFDWAGRTVIVSGGSRGLGLVLARQLIDQGARVALCARSDDDLRVAVEELRGRGGEVLSAVVDQRDAAQVRQFVQEVEQTFGTVDVMLNNAGRIEVGPWESMRREDYREAIDTHLTGAVHWSKSVVPIMRREGFGRIVNVASIGAKFGIPHLSPYVASKFALLGYSLGLRAELGRYGILVTTVSPGLIRTGSPRNVEFKGQHEKEYAWFAISDSLPGIARSAETVAKEILLAYQRGDAQVTLAGWMNGPLRMAELFPNWTAEAASLAARVLPAPRGADPTTKRGYESHSAWAPSLLTRAGDAAAANNNELRERS